jgi:hypothetical protein
MAVLPALVGINAACAGINPGQLGNIKDKLLV